jgi:hypothetical protein
MMFSSGTKVARRGGRRRCVRPTALAEVVVGVALEVSVMPARQEGAEALAGRAGEVERIVSSGRPSAP